MSSLRSASSIATGCRYNLAESPSMPVKSLDLPQPVSADTPVVATVTVKPVFPAVAAVATAPAVVSVIVTVAVEGVAVNSLRASTAVASAVAIVAADAFVAAATATAVYPGHAGATPAELMFR